MAALPRNFALLPVSPEDAPELVRVYFAAFQNPHSLSAWPRIPTVRKWWEDMLARECQDAHAHMFKIVKTPDVQPGIADAANVDTTSTESSATEIVAFVKWDHPRPEVEIDRNLPEWPDGSDKEMNQIKFSHLIEQRIRIMGPMENHWRKLFFFRNICSYDFPRSATPPR